MVASLMGHAKRRPHVLRFLCRQVFPAVPETSRQRNLGSGCLSDYCYHTASSSVSTIKTEKRGCYNFSHHALQRRNLLAKLMKLPQLLSDNDFSHGILLLCLFIHLMIRASTQKSYPLLAFEFFLNDGEQPIISLRIP